MDNSDLNTKYSYLLKQLIDNGLLNKNRLLKSKRITEEKLDALIGGNWYEPKSFIVCFSYAIASMVSRKFKLKKIPKEKKSKQC